MYINIICMLQFLNFVKKCINYRQYYLNYVRSSYLKRRSYLWLVNCEIKNVVSRLVSGADIFPRHYHVFNGDCHFYFSSWFTFYYFVYQTGCLGLGLGLKLYRLTNIISYSAGDAFLEECYPIYIGIIKIQAKCQIMW